MVGLDRPRIEKATVFFASFASPPQILQRPLTQAEVLPDSNPSTKRSLLESRKLAIAGASSLITRAFSRMFSIPVAAD